MLPAAILPRVAALPPDCARTSARRLLIRAATLAGSGSPAEIVGQGRPAPDARGAAAGGPATAPAAVRAAGAPGRRRALRRCWHASRSAPAAPAEHARSKRKLGGLALGEISVERRLGREGLGLRDRWHARRSCRAGAEPAGHAAPPPRAAHRRSGCRYASPRRRGQRVAPPLQADLAHGRLARDEVADAAELGRERRQGQQAIARGRRGQQGGEVAIGLAGAGRGDDGLRLSAPSATSVEVRRRHHGQRDGNGQDEVEPGEQQHLLARAAPSPRHRRCAGRCATCTFGQMYMCTNIHMASAAQHAGPQQRGARRRRADLRRVGEARRTDSRTSPAGWRRSPPPTSRRADTRPPPAGSPTWRKSRARHRRPPAGRPAARS